jgi:hypothetical protein
MAKQTNDYVMLADFEIKAQEFISLTFELSEQECAYLGSSRARPLIPGARHCNSLRSLC